MPHEPPAPGSRRSCDRRGTGGSACGGSARQTWVRSPCWSPALQLAAWPPVPVRTLAHAAGLMRGARQLGRYDIAVSEPVLDYPRLLARVREVVADVRAHSSLRQQIDSSATDHEKAGTARFADPHHRGRATAQSREMTAAQRQHEPALQHALRGRSRAPAIRLPSIRQIAFSPASSSGAGRPRLKLSEDRAGDGSQRGTEIVAR